MIDRQELERIRLDIRDGHEASVKTFKLRGKGIRENHEPVAYEFMIYAKGEVQPYQRIEGQPSRIMMTLGYPLPGSPVLFSVMGFKDGKFSELEDITVALNGKLKDFLSAVRGDFAIERGSYSFCPPIDLRHEIVRKIFRENAGLLFGENTVVTPVTAEASEKIKLVFDNGYEASVKTFNVSGKDGAEGRESTTYEFTYYLQGEKPPYTRTMDIPSRLTLTLGYPEAGWPAILSAMAFQKGKFAEHEGVTAELTANLADFLRDTGAKYAENPAAYVSAPPNDLLSEIASAVFKANTRALFGNDGIVQIGGPAPALTASQS